MRPKGRFKQESEKLYAVCIVIRKGRGQLSFVCMSPYSESTYLNLVKIDRMQQVIKCGLMKSPQKEVLFLP